MTAALAGPPPRVLSKYAPSGELHPVDFQEPPFWPRTSKKLALIAIVGLPSACHAWMGVKVSEACSSPSLVRAPGVDSQRA